MTGIYRKPNWVGKLAKIARLFERSCHDSACRSLMLLIHWQPNIISRLGQCMQMQTRYCRRVKSYFSCECDGVGYKASELSGSSPGPSHCGAETSRERVSRPSEGFTTTPSYPLAWQAVRWSRQSARQIAFSSVSLLPHTQRRTL